MRKFFLRFLYLIASIRHPNIRSDYRYFIRDNYYCRIYQVKYYLRDNFFRKKYKVVQFHGEFDQELRYVLPFAYWHFLNGTLKKTISCKNTREIYFFSPHHEERFDQRDWKSAYDSYEVPNMTHSISFSFNKWQQVPLKEYYSNSLFVYSKPILIIANKYNIEWDESPLNYLDIPTLDEIFRIYKDKYQIIYNRPLSNAIVSDNSEILDLKEYDWIRECYPEVLLMNDLFKQNRLLINNFNHLQLMVYSNCSHFVSVHGGTAALASYFGGVNIILSKRGIEHQLNEYDSIFPALSGAKILHAKKESEIFTFLKTYY